MKIKAESSKSSIFDPKFVRFASYLAATGVTWKDRDTDKLVCLVGAKFTPIVYELYREFYPYTKQIELIPVTRMGNPTFCTKLGLKIFDNESLNDVEQSGFLLGFGRRRIPNYLKPHENLFKIYLRILWEVHGELLIKKDAVYVSLKEKYSQELQDLAPILTVLGINCEISKCSSGFRLKILGEDSSKMFFDLIDWEADGQYGKEKIDLVKQYFKRA